GRGGPGAVRGRRGRRRRGPLASRGAELIEDAEARTLTAIERTGLHYSREQAAMERPQRRRPLRLDGIYSRRGGISLKTPERGRGAQARRGQRANGGAPR